MFFYVTWCFSMLQTLVIECYKQWLTSDPFVFRSISLPHVRQGAVSASAIGSAIHHYRGLLLHHRRNERTGRGWALGGTGRAKASGSEREGAQRKPLDPKGKERRVGRVEQKHMDQLFISGCPNVSISHVCLPGSGVGVMSDLVCISCPKFAGICAKNRRRRGFQNKP
jgi:hypothetical protein